MGGNAARGWRKDVGKWEGGSSRGTEGRGKKKHELFLLLNSHI